MDYYYYLHEKNENEYLFMNVYPYEMRLQYLDANNGDGIGGASIIYRKDMVKKLPGMGCQDATITGMNILSEWTNRCHPATGPINKPKYSPLNNYRICNMHLRRNGKDVTKR